MAVLAHGLVTGMPAQGVAGSRGPGPDAVGVERARRIVMVPVTFTGIDDGSRRELLAARLRAGLESGGATLVLATPSEPCQASTCLRALARAHEAEFVVISRVVADGRVYRMTLELYDREGVRLVDAHEDCEVCGLADVATLLRDQGAALWVKLEDLSLAVPQLEIRSAPADAAVTIDGVAVGHTPLRISVRPGRRQVSVSKPGFAEQTRALEAVGGTSEALTFELTPLPGPSRSSAPARRRALRIAAWTGVGVAVGGFVAGGTLLALDGREAKTRCTGDDRDAFGTCRYLHETTVAATITLSVASIATVAATVTALVSRRRGAARSRRPADGRPR